MQIDEYLKVVGDYADQIAQADQAANRDTMAVAEAMDAMYESREWVAEWLEQKPAPKRPTSRWQADSRNRFAQWQAWRLEQQGRHAITGPYTYRLLNARTIAKAIPNCATGTIGSEATIRPWAWLLRNRYENRIPEVWAIAVELAGSADKVTAKHTREALAEWKRRTFGKRRDGTDRSSRAAVDKAASAAGVANRIRAEIMRRLEEMYELTALNPKAMDELDGLFDDLNDWVEKHQAKDAA
jgi:hypothetical protein